MSDNDKDINFFEEFEDDLDFKVEYKILEITEEICNIMDAKELKRADLSKLLKTSKSAVTKMLNGSTNFTLKRLLKIAAALDKNVYISFTDPKKAGGFNEIKTAQYTNGNPEPADLADSNDQSVFQFPHQKNEPAVAETA